MMSSIKPGDAVLFERNGYFIGQINLYTGGSGSNFLTFGAYGTGKNPMISGAVPVKNWKRYTDNIYVTETDTVIKNLFVKGNQMTLARYPNSGYLKIKRSLKQPTKGLYDNELTQENGFWNGANLRVRSVNWAYEHSVIKNFSNKTITLSKETSYPLQPGWGYYLDNIFSELDHQNEWFYQNDRTSSAGKLYFFPSADIIPDDVFIEAGIYSYGIFCSAVLSNVLISDIEFRNQTVSGISFAGISNNVKIQNCSFRGQTECGINIVTKSRNCEILNCRFLNINGKGISLINTAKSTVIKNILENTGMIPGYGTTEDAFGMSAIIVLQSDSCIISGNYINNTGHDGINCIGYSNRIEKNIINNSLLLLNDGAAIKSYGKDNAGTVWNNNFIYNVPGNLEATPENQDYLAASGAYLDSYCSDMKVIDNTILNCGMASIFLYNECMNNYIKGNVCFDNNSGIIFHKEETPMNGNTVIDNKFYSTADDQLAVKLKSYTTGFIPGVFENNFYSSPVNYKIFSNEIGGKQTDFDFNKWKSLMKGNEVNSSAVVGNEVLYPRLFRNMSDDSLTIVLLSGYNYKDIYFNNVNGSVTIQPWSSVILFANSDVSKLPELNAAGGPLNFGNSTAPTWYYLSGENLKENLNITAPDGFEVSLDYNSEFSKSLTVNPVNGKVDKIIFVRFVPDNEKGYYDYIVNKSGSLVAGVKVMGSSR